MNTIIYQRTIEIELLHVESNRYINSGIENNDKDPKFEAGDHVRISKLKNIFAKFYTVKWSKKVCMIKRVKNTVPWTLLKILFNRRP